MSSEDSLGGEDTPNRRSSGTNTPQRKFREDLQRKVGDLSEKHQRKTADDIVGTYLGELGNAIGKVKTHAHDDSAFISRRAELAAYFTVLRDREDGQGGIQEIKNYVLSSSRSALVQGYFGWDSAEELNSKVRDYANGHLSEEIGRRSQSIAQSPGRGSSDTSSSSFRSRSSTASPSRSPSHAPFATGLTPATDRGGTSAPAVLDWGDGGPPDLRARTLPYHENGGAAASASSSPDARRPSGGRGAGAAVVSRRPVATSAPAASTRGGSGAGVGPRGRGGSAVPSARSFLSSGRPTATRASTGSRDQANSSSRGRGYLSGQTQRGGRGNPRGR